MRRARAVRRCAGRALGARGRYLYATVVIQALLGISLGLLAGYLGGRIDTFITRLADIQLALSTLILAIIVLALFRSAFGSESFSAYAVLLLVLVIGLAEWPYFARTARAVLPKLRRTFRGTQELVYDNYNALAIAWSPTGKVGDVICSIALSSDRFPIRYSTNRL